MSRKSWFFAPLMLSSLALVADGPVNDSYESQIPNQLIFRHLEGSGIGFNKGYTSLEAMIVASCSSQFLPYLNLRGHVFNDGHGAGNFGAGFRYLSDSMCQAVGVNVFYDMRKTSAQTYNQIGAGLEYLFPHWELRVNGYFPIGRKVSHRQDIKFDHFAGHNLFLGFKREFAFIGGDAEVAWHVQPSCYLNLYFGLGPYYFKGHYKQGALGGKARIEAKITDYITLQGIYSYDRLFHSRGSGELAFNIPFGKPKCIERSECCSCRSQRTLQTSLYQPPFRNEIVVVDRKKETEVAIDATGSPFFFVFVNNTSSSNGTFESPFPTLAQAQTNSKPGDVIYVFPGDLTTTGMDVGIALQDYQRLLGSAVPHQFNTQLGRITVPGLTTAYPKIANAGDNSVLMAFNTEAAGLNILDRLESFFPNIIVDRNIFSPTTIENMQANLTDAVGYMIVKDNLFQNDTSIALIYQSTGDAANVNTLVQNNSMANSGSTVVNMNLTMNGSYQTQWIGNRILSSLVNTGNNLIQLTSGVASHDLSFIDNTIAGTGFAVNMTDSTGSAIDRRIAFIGNNFLGTGLVLLTDTVPTSLDFSYNTWSNVAVGGLNMTVNGATMAFNMNHNLMDNIGFGTIENAFNLTSSSATFAMAIRDNYFLRSEIGSMVLGLDSNARVVIASNTFRENGNIAVPTVEITLLNGTNCVQVLNNRFINNFLDFTTLGAGGNICMSLVGNYAPSWGYNLNNVGATTFGITPTFSDNVGPFHQGGLINTVDFNSCCTLP